MQFRARESAAVRPSRTEVIAIIEDAAELRDILAELVKTGRALPGFDPALLN